jgi:hypothetical protein
MKLEFGVTQSMVDGLETLASDQLLTVSDHIRMAVSLYLRGHGLLPPPHHQANGKYTGADHHP